MEEPPPYPGRPRWVTISAILAGVLLMMVALLLVAGGGRHRPGQHFGGHTPTEANAHQ